MHRAAGQPTGCLFKSGNAAGRLPYRACRYYACRRSSAKAVVHTVGPVWRGGEQTKTSFCRMPISIATDWWRQAAIRQWLFCNQYWGYGLPLVRQRLK
ncbi:hypothetical protein [Klebsiella pneumoniae]|uniref:hypothetical protein n=1 Tax=Klebsiella pneumoniae TaxID=573 RepID=UPI003D339420